MQYASKSGHFRLARKIGDLKEQLSLEEEEEEGEEEDVYEYDYDPPSPPKPQTRQLFSRVTEKRKEKTANLNGQSRDRISPQGSCRTDRTTPTILSPDGHSHDDTFETASNNGEEEEELETLKENEEPAGSDEDPPTTTMDDSHDTQTSGVSLFSSPQTDNKRNNPFKVLSNYVDA